MLEFTQPACHLLLVWHLCWNTSVVFHTAWGIGLPALYSYWHTNIAVHQRPNRLHTSECNHLDHNMVLVWIWCTTQSAVQPAQIKTLMSYGKPHAPHDIFHHQAWRVVRPVVQITSCTYIQERINHVVLACIISTERKRELTAGWLACRTLWATSHVVYEWVTRRSIVLVTRSSCLSLFAARGIKALDVSRASSVDFMSVSHISGQMTM